jgi:hypothetical protein
LHDLGSLVGEDVGFGVFVFVDEDNDADSAEMGQFEGNVEDELSIVGDGGGSFDRFHRFRLLVSW